MSKAAAAAPGPAPSAASGTKTGGSTRASRASCGAKLRSASSAQGIGPSDDTRSGRIAAAGTFSAARAERIAVIAAMATSMSAAPASTTPPGPASGHGAVTRPTASP